MSAIRLVGPARVAIGSSRCGTPEVDAAVDEQVPGCIVDAHLLALPRTNGLGRCRERHVTGLPSGLRRFHHRDLCSALSEGTSAPGTCESAAQDRDAFGTNGLRRREPGCNRGDRSLIASRCRRHVALGVEARNALDVEARLVQSTSYGGRRGKG